MLTARRIVVLLLTGLFFSLFDYELALGQGQTQQQFQTYQNPTLGIKIQYPTDATVEESQEETDDDSNPISSVEFNIAGGTHFDIHVDLDPQGTSLVEYADS
jgi:hypothetical protein